MLIKEIWSEMKYVPFQIISATLLLDSTQLLSEMEEAVKKEADCNSRDKSQRKTVPPDSGHTDTE